MATNLEDRLVGTLFDSRYRIIRKLGSGGMAEVYLAEDEELGRKVALKILNERHSRDDQFVERFKREAQHAAGLSHPHIVRVYDRRQTGETYYIAMEYLNGPTLKELLVRKGPTPPAAAIKFARQILSALAEAHKNGIVHRDIKPHNVIVSPDWNIKVTDFGIARSGASQMTEAGSIVGTAQYLSPEQARGKPVDQRSDLYSLGIVMYEMLTGKVPFTGDAAVEIAMKHLQDVPPPPSSIRPEISHDLDAIVMRALAKDPADRYSSAEEMDADLARVARGAAVSHQTEEAMTNVLAGAGATSMTQVVPRDGLTPPPAPPAYRPPSFYDEGGRRRSPWPMILGIVAIAILGVVGYLIYNKVNTAIDSNQTVAVKNVVNVYYKDAETDLQAQGLQTQVQHQSSDSVQPEFVISQSPNPGTRVTKQTIVTLQVSTGIAKTKVPALTNLPVAQAQTELANADLKVATKNANSKTVQAGYVISSDPSGGTEVPVDSIVTLVVSSGPKQVVVPSVVGDQYENAVSALKGEGFGVSKSDVGNAAPSGQVVSQSPGGGTEAAAGATVSLTVSTGPQQIAVPSVTGDNQGEATQLLQRAGFHVAVTQQDVTDPTQDQLVLNQDPAGNSQQQQGSTVTITVGHLVTAPPVSTSTAATTTPATPTTSTTAATSPTTTPTTAATTTPTTTATTTTTTATTTAAVTTPTTPPGPAAGTPSGGAGQP
jgi:eukaryotic-like serine/threonine-protein kinase